MEEFVFDIKDKKISKTLPKIWCNSYKRTKYNWVDVPAEFSLYCEKLFTSLLDIKKYDRRFFNENNTYKIEEYIDIFDSVYKQITDLLIKKESYEKKENLCKKGVVDFYSEMRFTMLSDKYNYNNGIFEYTIDGYTKAFKDEAYKKLVPLVKKLFMIEKMCSFTTRKLWSRQLTKIEKFNPKRNFKILVKAIFPDEWRTQWLTNDLLKYYQKRIYQSASLIDKKHTHNLFQYYNSRVLAALIIEFDENKLVCGDRKDVYSEEYINNVNPLDEKILYSNLFLQENINENDENHKLYAEAVETITPNAVLNKITYYSEINFRNAKFVGVFVPNKISIDYCKEVAELKGLPLFYDESIK